MSPRSRVPEVLPRSFYDRSAHDVAREALNKVITHDGVSGRIVEVEVYDGANDAASHAYKGETPRNSVMFGRPGLLYVYSTYGMHYCANLVCGPEGQASAVLLRALSPLEGLDKMRERRGRAGSSDLALTSGPAKLCQALAIEKSFDGADLVEKDRDIYLFDDGTPSPAAIEAGPRIGIRKATENLWRYWIPGDLHVSRSR